MSKNIQNSTENLDVEKNASPYFDEYHDLFTFRTKPVPYAWLVELAHKVRKFADKKTTLRVNDFYDEIGMDPKDYYRFKAKCPELQAAHKYLIRRIASRRDKGAMIRIYVEGWTSKNQGRYDPGYLVGVRKEAMIKAEANAKAIKAEQGNGITNVYMDSIKIASTEVKEEKKDEERNP